MADLYNLETIKGIAEQNQKVLIAGGIDTLAQLVMASPAEIRKIFQVENKLGSLHPSYPTWPAQAILLTAQKKDEFDQLSEALGSGKADDLTKILGITPQINNLLVMKHIFTYDRLTLTKEDDLNAVLEEAGIENAEHVASWPRQAHMAYSDQWPELEQYQGMLGTGSSSGGSSGGDTSTGGGGGGSGDSGSSSDGGGKKMEPIVFLDMKERNDTARTKLEQEKYILEERKKDQGGTLQPELQKRLNEIDQLLKKNIVDPLYIALQVAFQKTNQIIGDQKEGKLPSQQSERPPKTLTADEIAFAAAYGIMLRDHVTNPDLGRRFNEKLALARAEFNQNEALFINVLQRLVQEGDRPGDQEGRFVQSNEWATVVRSLVERGVPAKDIHLGVYTHEALASHKGVDDGAPPSSLVIDLPDLEAQVEQEIIENNLHAMQAIYFAHMLEELKLFQVRDKLIELFQIGMLPVSKGRAGDILYALMKQNANRLSEYDRRNLYARTLGVPGGDDFGTPNREFQTLFLRFVSAVSSFARQMQLDHLLRAAIPARVHQEQVRKSGRDLAANLSLYGYGMAFFAATELQSQINEIIELLSNDDIKGAYGAKDMWGVIDQVAMLELGGARDSVKYRTMANSGAVIVRWLAKKGNELSSVNMGPILDVGEIHNPNIRPAGSKVTQDPYDSDLVNACERWLAVTGTPDAQIEQFSDPYEAPVTTSRPIQIPAIARDMLAGVGIGANGSGIV